MPLAAGQTLAHYRVIAPLGAGGMGEVYRAHDSRLNREVAIKVLPPSVATDADRLARFTREAQTLAVLNHPNIATIHGIEEADGIRALVMELVPGHDLSELLGAGPLPLVEALPIARQIAEALEAAHEQGIIHRDLKPGNIRVRPDGTVKVLDFGLAKALVPEPASGSGDVANSPTITTPAMTAAGVILGTAAYMAPEQARGRPVDRRADIWAFGVVLHEMLTGTRLFHGESVAETLGAIFTREPDLSKLPLETPPGIRGLIARCLVKDPRQRLRDIGDARLLIDDALAGRDARPPDAPAVAIRRPLLAWWALPLVALAGAAAGWAARPAPIQPVTKLSVTLPPSNQVTTYPAISGDGRMIAYAFGRTAATSQLYLRSLDAFDPTPVADSLGAEYPFFSPDGRSVAFFAAGKLRRAPVAGGASLIVAPAATPWGGTWDNDGHIVYTTGLGSGLWRVSEYGGAPEQLTKPDGADAGYAHVFPQRLPGTDGILFSLWGRAFFNAVLAPDNRTWREVTPAGRVILTAVYAPSGHLLSTDGASTVTAARWRPSDTTAVRPDTPVLKGVHWTFSADRPWLNVADNGTVAFVPGDPANRRVIWVDRQGRAMVVAGSGELLNQATLSRDGRKVLYGSMRGHWIVDLATGTRTTVVSEYRSWHGGWFPGDERLALSSNKDGDWDLYTVAASGGEFTPLLRRPLAQHVQDIGPDGTVIFLERHPVTGSDLWKLAPDGAATPLVVSPYNDESARLSPDGRFLAYNSDESGRREVFVVPAIGGQRMPISIGGGTGPVWSRDGRELFYRAGDDLVSVAVTTTAAGLTLGERRTLIDLSPYDAGYFHDFDVSADGQHFLLVRTEPESRPRRVDVIVNWFDELRAAVR